MFDLDGTLLNTLTDLYNAVNFALREFSFPERTVDEVKSFIGNGVKKLMERSTPEFTDEKTDEKCLDVFRQYYLEHMADNTAPFDGVTDLLKNLKQKGVKTAVVSNKLHSGVEGLCDDYFRGLIDEAIGVTNESERKPDPINVFRAMSLLDVKASDCIYVGDSEVDVQTAHNAKLKCAGITWGFRDKNVLVSAGADFIFDSCDELEKFLTL
ncbi:MAG: HAD family hydrolase [Acutalibacteraceae bacterium]